MRKRRTIGSDGKQVVEPTEKQKTFTKYGTPIGTGDFVGYHYKAQLSPEEIQEAWDTGSFLTEWRKLRGE